MEAADAAGDEGQSPKPARAVRCCTMSSVYMGMPDLQLSDLDAMPGADPVAQRKIGSLSAARENVGS